MQSQEFNLTKFLEVIKKKFFYFLILTLFTLLLPVLIYLNDEAEYTVSIIVEPKSSMEFANVQRDWESLHILSETALPFVGSDNNKDTKLSSIMLADFLSIITSPTNINETYENYYRNNEFNEKFEEIYNNFNVVFDGRSFSKRKDILLVSFTSKSEDLSEKFIFEMINKSYDRVKKNLNASFLDLIEITQIFNNGNTAISGLNDFVRSQENMSNLQSVKLLDILDLYNDIYKKNKISSITNKYLDYRANNSLDLLIFSKETMQVKINKINIINYTLIFILLGLFLNYILFIFFIFSSRNKTK